MSKATLLPAVLVLALAAPLLAACGDPDPLPPPSGGGNGDGGGGDGGGGDGGGGSGGAGGSGGGGDACGGCPEGTACNEETETCVSTQPCDPACGAGFTCQAGICLPDAGSIGAPCAAAAECTSGECAFSVTGEGLCVAPCGAGCPAGTHCVAAVDRCVSDAFTECEGIDPCPGSAACTYWTMAGAQVGACSLDAGAGAISAVCTSGAECATGLCSEASPSGRRICTSPCLDDFGCAGVSETCTSQALDTPAGPLQANACASEDTGGIFGDCCATDADCSPGESSGCRMGSGGTMSCASAGLCETSEECLFSLPGVGVREGECVGGVCVAVNCTPR